MLEAEVGTFAEVAFLESVADGSFELVNLATADAVRMAGLVERYGDPPTSTRILMQALPRFSTRRFGRDPDRNGT